MCSEEWFGKKIDVESLKKVFDSSVSASILEALPVPKKTKVFDFERKEVDFLKSVGVWDTLKQNLHEHEKITIEGYERFETDEG